MKRRLLYVVAQQEAMNAQQTRAGPSREEGEGGGEHVKSSVPPGFYPWEISSSASEESWRARVADELSGAVIACEEVNESNCLPTSSTWRVDGCLWATAPLDPEIPSTHRCGFAPAFCWNARGGSIGSFGRGQDGVGEPNVARAALDVNASPAHRPPMKSAPRQEGAADVATAAEEAVTPQLLLEHCTALRFYERGVKRAPRKKVRTPPGG